MKDIISSIYNNRIESQKLATKSRNLINELVRKYGTIMPDEEFYVLTDKLVEQIDKAKKRFMHSKSGVHNFFCDNYRDNEQNIINFVHTYIQKVDAIRNNHELWENASNYEYFSDDGWYDFTDYLPLYGKEAYDHVMFDRREHEVYNSRHEDYILSTLIDKLMLFVSPEEEEEED